MSDNKFIKRLKGEQTAKSVLEIKNESAKTSFANMPQGTSNAINVYSDHRGNATAVLNGTTNWKVSNSELLLVDTVSGDGQDFTSTYTVIGTGLWVNASYTFPSTGDPRHPVAMVFNPSTKWVLKVCGDNLIVDGGSTVDFTMLVKIGTSNVYSKNFTIRENAGQFSKEFIIDFGEANSDVVKAGGLSTLTVQLLCGTANASARIYNGMTVLTCLQRKVDAYAVSNSSANVGDVLDGNIIPSDYFSNPAFIDQVEDGEDAYAIFTRDGDDVNFSGWTPKEEIATKSALTAHIDDKNNPHEVTKTQVGLGNVDNTADLNKPISTATQTALNGKQATISDLATIRSNAQAGKSASDTIATYGDIVSCDAADFATSAQGALAATAVQPGDLATVATSGSYNDLSNKPTIPAAQVNSDWNAISGVAQILNKPTLGTMAAESASDYTKTSGLAAVATSGSYTDLSNKPTIPSVGNGTITITQGGVSKGTFTTNQSGNTTIEVDAGAGNPVWGGIGGTLSDQTDLQNALNAKADDNAVVHLAGAETITGTKTFTYTTWLKLTDTDHTVAPSVYKERMYGVEDMNNKRIGSFGVSINQNTTTVRCYMGASKEINGSYRYSLLETYIDDAGNKWTSAPTPSVSSNDTNIATTAFVNNLLNSKIEFIAHQAMPSNRSVDLTLPASGGTITAPADGYIHFAKNATAANQRLKLYTTTQMAVASWSTGAYNIEVLLPVSKGETVNVLYTAGGTTNFFRFTYANGAQ